MQPELVIEALLNGEDGWDATWFTPAFLAQVPVGQIRDIMARTRATIGPPVAVSGGGQSFVVQTRTHTLDVTLVLDAQDRISGLWIGEPDARERDIASILAEMESLAPQVSYLIVRDGDDIAARNRDKTLAVGSAFKLGVLKAVRDRIADGAMGWESVLTLKAHHVSLPTGILQTFPVGAPVTVHTAAALMIAQSDNTATDLLMDTVGRETVAAALGIETVLTTREVFVIKGNSAVREAFCALDPGPGAARDAVMTSIAGADLPDVSGVTGPHVAGAEWYLSSRSLCALIAAVADAPVMHINPGLARPGRWQQVAYKGGSETGVLNFTTHLVGRKGARYGVTATWNADEAIAEQEAAALYAALLSRLADEAGD